MNGQHSSLSLWLASVNIQVEWWFGPDVTLTKYSPSGQPLAVTTLPLTTLLSEVARLRGQSTKKPEKRDGAEEAGPAE